MEDLVTYEIAKKLKEKGFDEGCEFTFYNNYRVRDEIYEKHPGLSDDGYEDLRSDAYKINCSLSKMRFN